MTILLTSVSAKIGNTLLLENINMHIRSGELIVLLGPNGAGKSTLLKVCAGDIPSSEGIVTLNNKLLSLFTAKELATLRAVMTQSYEMVFSFSVEEVIAMGCVLYEHQISYAMQQDIIKEVMEILQITHLAKRQFTTLSGGEQQRTQLARVLAQLWYPQDCQATRYLFLDEPTSSLDIKYQYEVLKVAKKITEKNIAVVAVVHDLSLACCFADHLILLQDGKIITEGKPEQVLQPTTLDEVYGIKGQYIQYSSTSQASVVFEKSER